MNLAEQSCTLSPRASWDPATRDEELLHAVKTGSHTAFAELKNIYGQRLYKRILCITRNHEDAEDALQDTFIRAYLGLHSFEGRSSLFTWLTRIAINSALMSMRKRRSRPEVPLEAPLDPGNGSISFDVRDSALDPEQLCDQNQRCERIERSLRALDPMSRTTVFMRMSKEKSMKEIALELDVTVASAKARLHRARKRLARVSSFPVPKAS
jgi:RNA polymerase sigma-70 factor (ECF subfamily)